MLNVKAVKGVIRGGKVEFIDHFDAADGTEVVVNVPIQPTNQARCQMMTYGMFANGAGRESTPEELQEAKKLWEREWERSWDRLEQS